MKFGNICVQKGDEGFFIKRTGAYFDVASEPVFVYLDGDAPLNASTEYRVHRAVYIKTSHAAMIHAHPPVAVAASMVMDKILPHDSEGELLCPMIQVVTGAPGSQEIADNVAAAL